MSLKMCTVLFHNISSMFYYCLQRKMPAIVYSATSSVRMVLRWAKTAAHFASVLTLVRYSNQTAPN